MLAHIHPVTPGEDPGDGAAMHLGLAAITLDAGSLEAIADNGMTMGEVPAAPLCIGIASQTEGGIWRWYAQAMGCLRKWGR